MSLVLWRSSLRYLFRHPWQVSLSILGVALGVAIFVSIDLANQSAKRAFALSTEAVTGQATHQITGGPAGLSEEVYHTLRVDNNARAIAPVVEGYATATAYSRRTFRLLGVDPFAEALFRPYLNQANGGTNANLETFLTQPGTALLAVETARSMNLAIGDAIPVSVGGVRQTVTLVGLVQPADDVSRQAIESLLITDIATAQELLDAPGHLSRIDLIIPDGPTGDRLLGNIRSLLPPGAQVTRSSSRTETVDQMTRTFDINLTALSLLALVVGVFLIYNTVTFSVVRRRTLIGTLRALGVTRREIFTLILSEALLIGLVSSTIGVALGILLGRGLVQLITQTINDIYFVVSVRELAVQPLLLVKGGALGVAATLVAAAVPAFEATTVPTRTALTRSSIETGVRRTMPRTTFVGAFVMSVGLALLIFSGKNLLLSFIGLFAMVFGFAMLVPMFTTVLIALLSWLIGRSLGLTGAMSARGVSASLSRTAVAIAALTIAVATTVGIGIMVSSFREGVVNWLDASLQADVYVSPPTPVSSRIEATLDSSVVERLTSAHGVESVSSYRRTNVDSPNGQVELVALGMTSEVFRRHQFTEGDPASIWPGFLEGEAIIVSEPYAYNNDVETGDSVHLLTNQGMRDFLIAGVFNDYSPGQGLVMMSRSAYMRFWDDEGISSLGIYVTPGSDPEALIDSLRRLTGPDQELVIRSNRTLRDTSLEVFDRAFAITSIMRVLAMVVAFIGVLSALMALQLERAREIGVLRTIGFTPRQVWGLVTSQTGLMGLVAGLLAMPVGIGLAIGLIFVVNRRSFGWSIQMEIAPSILLEGLALAVIAAIIAGLYPALKMATLSVAQALREE